MSGNDQDQKAASEDGHSLSNKVDGSDSSTNSWTLLNPEDGVVESLGNLEDGTETLADVPSITDDVPGASTRREESASVETVLSEEGHEVCQETAPDSGEGPVPSSPARLSPRAGTPQELNDLDMESQPPVIHDIVTTSPGDNEHLGAMPFVTNISLSPAVDARSAEPEHLSFAGASPSTEEEEEEEERASSQHLGKVDDSEVKVEKGRVPETLGAESAGGAEDEELAATHDLDGVRRRNLPSADAARTRTSDEDDDEEDLEFKMAEKKEEKPWFSLSKCIAASLVLIFLGSLYLSGDFDSSELSDGEQSQDQLSEDPQDMSVLLEQLTQENLEITRLEAELQTKAEELNSELRAASASGDERVREELERENAKLKEELSSLPVLRSEVESLRARVTELSELAVDPAPAGSSTRLTGGDAQRDNAKEELQRQKTLLLESKKRLSGMKKDGGGDRKRLHDGLERIHEEVSQHVERWGKKKAHKRKDGKGEKKEWKREKEWKSQKSDSHKEAWRKHQDEWEGRKGERRMDREERRKEKPWHGRSQQQQQRQQHGSSSSSFWRDQEVKLHRNVRPQLGCSSLEDCAGREGLYPVELPEFEELLEGYLSKLERSPGESKKQIRKLTADFFEDGVFIHDRVLFSDFAEDVADVLEDMVDLFEAGGPRRHDSLEEEMEEFEREAMWKFAAAA